MSANDHLDAIRHHLSRLEPRDDIDDWYAVGRYTEALAADLEAERARVARHQWSIAAYRENVYEAFGGDEACPEVVSESEQMLTAEDREAIHDLPDEEATL